MLRKFGGLIAVAVMIVVLAGLLCTLSLVITQISALFDNIKTMFGL